MQSLASRWGTLCYFFQVKIWQPQYLKDVSTRGRYYAVVRVVSITISGLLETKAASRAAALSFSSLLGLGPLISIAVLIAGFALDSSDPDLAAKTVNRVISYVAPQLAEYERLAAVDAAHKNGGTAAPTAKINPEVVQIINDIITSSRSSAVGVFGSLTLILIVLQLFTSIETAFNEIWGVRRGRSWLMRLVFYWTILTLGAVLFFAAATGLSAGALLNAFAEKIPYGASMLNLLKLLLPVGSALLLAGMLTVFYRAIPNTRVQWRAALIGAIVVALLILLNNFLAFLYFKRVLMMRSLYGSLGVGLILMFGLYFFWFFVLLGGTVSYAVQNVHFRNSQAAWNSLSESLRERLTLIVLLTIGRRFDACLPASTASQLSESLKVPTQILNECINRLIKMQLITPIPSQEGETTTDFRFQPARPLNRINLREFKRRDDDLGDPSAAVSLTHLDPILQAYDQRIESALQDELFARPLDQLFAEHPFNHPSSQPTPRLPDASSS
ncbi:MAG: YihY/virulence factor BrkB family protein [Opitutaceae bacterium]|nr:YihY/virulence factor BrkB family protein [Opitutaceae bacterium]